VGDAGLVRALATDYRSAPLSERDRAMLDYAVKLTREPRAVTAADVGTLRSVGFDDTAVLDVCQVVSYYNYVNRLADGLGVELESWWRDEELTVSRAEFESRRGGGGAGGST
jgi:uncharacterized peroxidase-related enzyme